MPADKIYYTIEEVADLLKVNYQLIYRLVRSVEIPAIRIGRVYRIESNDLEDYLEKRKVSNLGGIACSSCKTIFRSSLSLNRECQECGAPICIDCWERKGIKYCIDHTPAK